MENEKKYCYCGEYLTYNKDTNETMSHLFNGELFVTTVDNGVLLRINDQLFRGEVISPGNYSFKFNIATGFQKVGYLTEQVNENGCNELVGSLYLNGFDCTIKAKESKFVNKLRFSGLYI